jgi:universal stress protein A
MGCYRNILVATDFSRHSEAAARRAAEIARACGARMQLLYVVEHFPADMPCDVVTPEDVDPEVFITEVFESRLVEFAQGVGLGDAPRQVVLESGSAKHEIVETARRLDADLIVIGSHGRHGMAAWLGSTAAGVMHRAACDVLTVRAPD